MYMEAWAMLRVRREVSALQKGSPRQTRRPSGGVARGKGDVKGE